MAQVIFLVGVVICLVVGYVLWREIRRNRSVTSRALREAGVEKEEKVAPRSGGREAFSDAEQEASVDQIKDKVQVDIKSVRFNFAGDLKEPEVHLVFRLANYSRSEVFIKKIRWQLTISPKVRPSVKGSFSEDILLLAQSSVDQLAHSEVVDHVEARYVSQSKRGLASSCHVEGTVSGRVRGTEFEKEFSLFHIPCLVEDREGPLSEMCIEPTHVDPLTGLLNRRFLADNLQAIVDSAKFDQPISFIMLDIDDFKSTNDQYGHLVGDDVIKAVCAKMREVVLDRGFSIRYGGDELCVVLINCDQPKAKRLAEEIRSHVEQYIFEGPNGRVPITVSLGVATAHEKTEFTTLIQRADDMLRAAKKSGKNKVYEWAVP